MVGDEGYATWSHSCCSEHQTFDGYKQSKREGNQIPPFVRWQNNIPLKALSGNDLVKRVGFCSVTQQFVLGSGRSYQIQMSVCSGLYLDPLTRSVKVCHLFPSS